MAEINLKDFIVEAITQITDGIIESQKSNSVKGCIINPKTIQTIGAPETITYRLDEFGSNIGTVSILNFDLIIDANEKSDKGGGLKVRTGVIGLGGDLKSEKINSINNKLTFSIPISFPFQKATSR